MKKNSRVLIFLLILSACASAPSSISRALTLAQFESLKTGDTKEQVIKVLGKPNEIRKSVKTSDNVWIYEEEGAQRGAIAMDSKEQQVTGITVIPRETENEARLDFLIKNKFSSGIFTEAPLQRCGRDFLPQEIFYIDSKKGIIVEARRDTNDVYSFSWTSPTYASELIENIKTCKR